MHKPMLENIKNIANGIYLEGLAVDRVSNLVWFSDVIGGGIHSLNSSGEIKSYDADRQWTGGILLNKNGVVFSSGQYGIKWLNPHVGSSGWLINEVSGEPIPGVNEMAPDYRGGMFFGTCDIESVIASAAPRPTKIFHLSTDNSVKLIADDIGFANGLMYDPTKNKLYCNDTFSCSWVFDLNDDLAVIDRRVLIEKLDADGMALDCDGNVWITGYRSSELLQVSPKGDLLASIETPASAITQIRFGGQDMKDIYINSVPRDGGDSLKEGEIPTERQSVLFKGRSNVAGMNIPQTELFIK
ncbi:SMP-30/gluconolactonase/LRE family protein [Halioxenophilus sp. WMMB6]|uniref:SMP-30/gluconolactonase/LRE family protein n=1 Tax=Halioxenophilus sp. WMMB6 TaxID=3073815 RepID=UPI00295EDB7F|nr:SMP-30/gluconolactonase/LRE family protein [Halioxenophilus sp. WMMB6]